MTNIDTISENVKLLSRQIESEINRISQEANTRPIKTTDSLIYIGNWQDAIPRSIWTDATLSAMDVRCWGVIRTQAVSRSAVMLSLNTLLKETLGYSKATISRVIYVLRLTRWISLCSSLRSETGQFRGNIYAIHDAPVPLQDAIYLDQNYLDFVKKQLTHNNKTIRQLAETIWQTIYTQLDRHTLSMGSESQSVNEALRQILHAPQTETTTIKLNNRQVQKLNPVKNSQVQKMNPATKHQVQNLNLAGQKTKNQENQEHNIQVQKMNPAPICSSRCSSSLNNKFINKSTTTNSEGISKKGGLKIKPTSVSDDCQNLIYPKSFNQNEIQLADIYLSKIDPTLRQDFLDETAAQIKQRSKTNNPIRNPIGYLSWLCNQYQQGNTYLTSAYINFRKQRKRKEQTERKLKEQQQAMTHAALAGEIKSRVKTKQTQSRGNSDKKQKLSRVAELKNAVKGKKND